MHVRVYVNFIFYYYKNKDFFIFRYLVKGHTQNDGVSMHSAIGTEEQWCDVMRNAKVNEPKYLVNKMTKEDFFNFSQLSNENFWSKIRISQIREIKFFPDKRIEVRYNYENIINNFDVRYNESATLTNCYEEKLLLDLDKEKGSSIYD